MSAEAYSDAESVQKTVESYQAIMRRLLDYCPHGLTPTNEEANRHVVLPKAFEPRGEYNARALKGIASHATVKFVQLVVHRPLKIDPEDPVWVREFYWHQLEVHFNLTRFSWDPEPDDRRLRRPSLIGTPDRIRVILPRVVVPLRDWRRSQAMLQQEVTAAGEAVRRTLEAEIRAADDTVNRWEGAWRTS